MTDRLSGHATLRLLLIGANANVIVCLFKLCVLVVMHRLPRLRDSWWNFLRVTIENVLPGELPRYLFAQIVETLTDGQVT